MPRGPRDAEEREKTSGLPRPERLPLPERPIPELAAKQADLSRVKRLVLCTPQQCPQLRLGQRVRFQNGLVQLSFVQIRKLSQHLLVHSVEDGSDFDLAGILG